MRLLLGLVVIQAAGGAVLALIEGVSGPPDTGDTGLLIATGIAAWLTPTVYDIGLGTHHGSRWRLLAATGIAAATLIGLALGAPGTGLTAGLLVWIAITMGWLGVAFLVATVLRTPGCEMRYLTSPASSPPETVTTSPAPAGSNPRRVGIPHHRPGRTRRSERCMRQRSGRAASPVRRL